MSDLERSAAVEVPVEFKLFMHLMAGSFCSSDVVSLPLAQLRRILTEKHGAAYANAYVYELAQAFAGNRHSFVQDFCG